ncbi:hypothetical protein N9137_00820 [Pseudomonadales bacterium]|nr:hypothetical protein [Pseudomonadales bacterium]
MIKGFDELCNILGLFLSVENGQYIHDWIIEGTDNSEAVAFAKALVNASYMIADNSPIKYMHLVIGLIVMSNRGVIDLILKECGEPHFVTAKILGMLNKFEVDKHGSVL